jgi:hypothetical protein
LATQPSKKAAGAESPRGAGGRLAGGWVAVTHAIRLHHELVQLYYNCFASQPKSRKKNIKRRKISENDSLCSFNTQKIKGATLVLCAGLVCVCVPVSNSLTWT